MPPTGKTRFQSKKSSMYHNTTRSTNCNFQMESTEGYSPHVHSRSAF